MKARYASSVHRCPFTVFKQRIQKTGDRIQNEKQKPITKTRKLESTKKGKGV